MEKTYPYDEEYEPDETAVDSAMHPDKAKQNDIWINIGSEQALAYICIPTKDLKGNTYFSRFDMNSDKEIDEVISMLELSKILAAEYQREFWVELGLAPPDDDDESETG